MDELPSHARRKTANRVKNKAPAKVQITAEQLLREAWERKDSVSAGLPKIQIADHEELLEYQRNERTQYEMRIVRNRSHTALWIRYARWEEDQQEFVRARSIWERAIDNDYRNPVIWLNYAEMEMRHRFINHARNILDRAVALLPRADQLWLKYAHMEEMLSQLNLARLVYQRWLKWYPENTAYFAFIRFELRHGEVSKARAVYEQLLIGHRTAHSYIKFAKFEERQDEFAQARHVYERASQELPKIQLTPGFFLAFAKYEERLKQKERARAIYKFAIQNFPKESRKDLETAYTNFEKHQGDRDALEDILVSSKRAVFEAALTTDPHDYDAWFDLIQMEESSSPSERIRSTYERAVSNIPPVASKPAWGRYIYLWISYAVWTELSCNDLPGAIRIYKRCVGVIPNNHRKFSFAKLWILYAQAEIRRKDISAARRILGTGLGVLPEKHSIYQAYIELETALGEVDRARKLYETWLTRHPTYTAAFLMMVDMEMGLGEIKRAMHVLELAISTGGSNDLNSAWMKLAEIVASSEPQVEAIRTFERYISSNSGKLVWNAYIAMLKRLPASSDIVRKVYERAVRKLNEEVVGAPSGSGLRREEAFEMGQEWLEWETALQKESEDIQKNNELERVHRLIPRRVRRERRIDEADGGENRTEEYWEILLPEEEVGTDNAKRKLVEAAKRWRLKKVSTTNET